MNRLTLHDLLKVDLSGLKTIDGWLDRLESYGMMVGHSTGTTGKLSFIPRSKVEWPAWQSAYFLAMRAAIGLDPRDVQLPQICDVMNIAIEIAASQIRNENKARHPVGSRPRE